MDLLELLGHVRVGTAGVVEGLGWGYSSTAAWSDATMLGTRVPASIDAGQAAGTKFADARAALDAFDPARVFSNSLINTFLP